MTDRPKNEDLEHALAEASARGLGPREAAEVPLVAEILADSSTWAEPRAGLEDAVVRAVADAEPATTSSPGPASRGPRSRRRRALVAALAAAAVIALVVVATVFVTRGGTDGEYEAKLAATDVAPGAHATAEFARTDAGFRVTLDAKGLRELRPGEYYQAWLKNSAGTLVPIGTFSSSDGRVTLWSGVSPQRFPTITVTVEAADDDQASSGVRVLVGDAHSK
jgi:hypothetical protein